jgi:hypothetical protein
MKLVALIAGMAVPVLASPLLLLGCSGADNEPTGSTAQDLTLPGFGDAGALPPLPALPTLPTLPTGFPVPDAGFVLPPPPFAFLQIPDGGFILPTLPIGFPPDAGIVLPTLPILPFLPDGGFFVPTLPPGFDLDAGIVLPTLPIPLPTLPVVPVLPVGFPFPLFDAGAD